MSTRSTGRSADSGADADAGGVSEQPLAPGPRSTHSAPLVLLGPQRRPRVERVLQALGLADARVGFVNAGWRERESEDAELTGLGDGHAVNLRLYARMADVWARDPDYATAEMQRRETLTELDELYLAGTEHVVSAIVTILGKTPRNPRVHAEVLADAEGVMRQVDARHLVRVQRAHDAFWAGRPPHERPVIAEHRHAVAEQLRGCDVVLVAGGHVGVLLRALHLFNLAAMLHQPVLAWSAGAMALTERVVLFNDRAVHGPTLAHVYSLGLGLAAGVVALPAARSRLALEDHARMAMLRRRFAPAACLLLDDGVRVDLPPHAPLPGSAPVLLADGTHGSYSADIASAPDEARTGDGAMS